MIAEAELPYFDPTIVSLDELERMRGLNWVARSPRGFEVLRYRQGLEVLEHPAFEKGASFRRRLDDIGIVSGDVRERWERMLVSNEGEARSRLRIPLTTIFKPAQMAKLQKHVRAIIETVLDEIPDPANVDFMRDIAWKIPPRIYCHLVSAPVEQAPLVARLSDSTLSPLLTVDRARVQETIDAFYESLAFVEEHIEARRSDLGDDFTSVMIRQQMEGLLTQEELIYEAVSILQASIDNTVHQLGLTFGTLLEEPARWEALVAQPALLPTAVEETIRLRPRFGTIFRYVPNEAAYDDIVLPAESWIFVSIRSVNRDELVFDDPNAFQIQRRPSKALMFGGGPYNCLGQTLARLEIHETIRAILARFPTMKIAGDWSSRDANAVSETEHLHVSLI
ncbi:cytochrome P450 [Sphingomonas sp. MMS24-J13]|uniref:cytochrome P450 n=1 Tax=Sphingomonas sp. MMS24-J13 TaxID=3238686 RepID=UPI00384EC23B